MKKLILYSFAVIILIIGIIVLIPFVFKDKLNQFILKEINKNPVVTVDYRSLKIKIFKHFPDVSIYLEDFSLHSKAKPKQDLLYTEELLFSFDLFSVLRNEPEVNQIGLIKPRAYYTVQNDGESNWDFLIESENEDTEQPKEDEKIKFSIEKYYITRGRISYEDKASDISCEIKKLSHEGSGDFQSNSFTLFSTTDALLGHLIVNGETYAENIDFTIDSDLLTDLEKGHYEIKDNLISLNDLVLTLNGSIEATETTHVDIRFQTNSNKLSGLISLFPSFKKDLKDVDVSGSLTLKGNLAGEIADGIYPDFNIEFGVSDGKITYAEIDQTFDQINLDGKIIKKGGKLDNTELIIPEFSLVTSGKPLKGSVNISNLLSDQKYNASLDGNIDLGILKAYLAENTVDEIAGNMEFDIFLKAFQSDFDNKNYSNIDAGGIIKATDVIIRSDELPAPLSINIANLSVKPQSLFIKELKGKIGESDFSTSGNLTNVLNYMLDDGLLSGHLSLNSTYFNVNEWQKDNQTENVSEDPEGVYLIPAKVNVNIIASISKVLYDELLLNDVSGNLTVKNSNLYLNRITASGLGGKLSLDGVYSTAGGNASFDLNYNLRSLDISKTVEAMQVVQKYIPVAKFIEGKIESRMSLKGDLTDNIDIDPATLTGQGVIEIPAARVKDIPALEKIVSLTKLKNMDQLVLKDVWTHVKFNNGKIAVEPFSITKEEIVMTISGTNGFDQVIDYDVLIDVPSNKIGEAKTLVTDWLSKSPIPGLKQLIPDIVRFEVKVSGQFLNPTVALKRISKGDGGSTKDEVKDIISEQIENEKEKVKAEIKKMEEEIKTKYEETKEEVKEKVDEQIEETKTKSEEKAKEKLKDILNIP